MNNDRRSRKTRNAIKAAFLELGSQKEISKISIKEIADLADINRKTFYNHYHDVYDVLEDIEQTIIDKVLKIIDENDIAGVLADPYKIFLYLTQIITEDEKFYALFVNSANLDLMLEKIKGVVSERLISEMIEKTKLDRDMIFYIIEFELSGLIFLYKSWFNSKREMPLEKLSNQISIIIINGVSTIMNDHNE